VLLVRASLRCGGFEGGCSVGQALKWLIGGLAGLAVLVLAVRARGRPAARPRPRAGPLVSVVREQTGRELQIAQPVDLGFFPGSLSGCAG